MEDAFINIGLHNPPSKGSKGRPNRVKGKGGVLFLGKLGD